MWTSLMDHLSLTQVAVEGTYQLLDGLTEAVRVHDADTCFGDLETLHMISQQHNTKEEGILYPLADRSLQGGGEGLIERLDSI